MNESSIGEPVEIAQVERQRRGVTWQGILFSLAAGMLVWLAIYECAYRLTDGTTASDQRARIMTSLAFGLAEHELGQFFQEHHRWPKSLDELDERNRDPSVQLLREDGWGRPVIYFPSDDGYQFGIEDRSGGQLFYFSDDGKGPILSRVFRVTRWRYLVASFDTSFAWWTLVTAGAFSIAMLRMSSNEFVDEPALRSSKINTTRPILSRLAMAMEAVVVVCVLIAFVGLVGFVLTFAHGVASGH